MDTDAELLKCYAEDRSEEAFTELVRRHIDLVYSAALREAHGDAAQAEDVSQAVFAELARQASRVRRHPALAGWLYTCVRRMTANARRTNQRRQRREQEAQTMNELLFPEPTESAWRQVQPAIDDAMHELGETDRAAVVLRFFEERPLREVGLALGLNENAARMRVDRALDKLRGLLAKRGVTSTASGLSAAIAAGAVMAAPANLAAVVTAGALSVPASAATSLAALKLMTLTKLKVGLLSAVAIAGVATPLVVQQRAQSRLSDRNAELGRQVDQLAHENARLSNLVARAAETRTLSQDQLRELMKLRGEVGFLRKQTNELDTLRQDIRRLQSAQAGPAQNAQPPTTYTVDEYQKQEGIAKLNYAKYWVLAFHLYMEKNQGRFPASLDQALPYLPEEARVEMNLPPDEFLPNTPKFGLTPDRFEIVYSGTLTDIPNPASVIVFREKQAWGENGRWRRAYGFADGHSEIHLSQDGNFDAWEQQHMIAPATPGQQ